MLIDKNSLIINGINFAKYITQIEYGYNKLWGNDSGRNLNGDMAAATLLGIYPKLKLSFRKLTQQELETIVPILDSASQQVTYYDPVLKRLYTMETYTGDWATLNRTVFTLLVEANESFEISFIAMKKRPKA